MIPGPLGSGTEGLRDGAVGLGAGAVGLGAAFVCAVALAIVLSHGTTTSAGIAVPSPDDRADAAAATGDAGSRASPSSLDDSAPVGRVAEPARIRIAAIGVDAPLVGVGLEPDGAMAVPDLGLAGWYTPGPRPGDPGPAVIAAHVDSRSGPDVFFRLRELQPGDVVEVELVDGTTEAFVVTSSEQRLKTELPVDRIWSRTDRPVLRLITCGGDFDRSRRSYLSNTIVYADDRP